MTNTSLETTPRIRIDKWLWAARFFKTRNLAIEAINGGKVHLNGQRTKPAKEIKLGDMLSVRKGSVEFIVVVKMLSKQRRSATEAALLYVETPESIEKREQMKSLKQQESGMRPRGLGRPTKRDRRLIHQFKRNDQD